MPASALHGGLCASWLRMHVHINVVDSIHLYEAEVVEGNEHVMDDSAPLICYIIEC